MTEIVERLEQQAVNVENDGHLNAARYMREAKARIEALEAENARWRENMRQNYDAFTAMRNDINELVGNMTSQESTLRHGPEMVHECEAVVEAVRAFVQQHEGKK